MRHRNRLAALLLALIILAVLVLGCDDTTGTVYGNPTRVASPYEAEIALHDLR